jgi:hypothetical protein
MKTAYSVSLTNSVRKTEDSRDLVNYQIWVADTRYYSKDADRINGQYPKTVRFARPMTQECATLLAAQLKNMAQQVRVVELVADDDQYLPGTLEELRSPVDEPLGITALKSAVGHCLKSGMPVSEVLEIARSEVFGAESLRAAIQECLADKRVKDEDIFATVDHSVQAAIGATT